MKRIALFFFLLSAFTIQLNADHGTKVIVLDRKGELHLEYYVPADMPDVYYDNVNQTIIIDGGGEVTYYDVEIAPVTSSVQVITTQVSGYYDTIDVSSLPATEYVITIYSPENNTYEGFFEIE